MKKLKDHAFRKDVYLLGKDSDGIRYWLEAPSWDCDWYWGFGYIETYQGNRLPNKARDIESHQHANREYKVSGDYDTNIFYGKFLVDKTFDDKEGWELAELMKEFYFLRESAQYWNSGNCHISGDGMIPKMAHLSENINNNIIPKITDRIIKILTP